MKKWFLLLIALALAACVQASPSPMPTSQVEQPKQPTQKVSPATLAVAKTLPPQPTKTLEIKSGDVMPGCTVSSAKPTTGPTPESVFGGVTAQDWVTGPETATVTLIEYSDFQ